MPSSLLLRSPLLPDESLLSLLFRLAELNQYESTAWLEQVVQDRSGLADSLNRPRRPQTYAILSALTGISPNDLYAATIHPFANILSLPDDQPDTIGLAGHQLPLLTDGTRPHEMLHIWEEILPHPQPG